MNECSLYHAKVCYGSLATPKVCMKNSCTYRHLPNTKRAVSRKEQEETRKEEERRKKEEGKKEQNKRKEQERKRRKEEEERMESLPPLPPTGAKRNTVFFRRSRGCPRNGGPGGGDDGGAALPDERDGQLSEDAAADHEDGAAAADRGTEVEGGVPVEANPGCLGPTAGASAHRLVNTLLGGNAGEAGLLPNSYRGKVQHWSDLAAENNSLFVCLQETHLHPGVLDAEINLKNFTTFRTDQQNCKNGGVVNYIREDLVVREEFSFSNSYCESSAQHIPKLKLCLINIYRPPNCPSIYFQETLGLVEDFLEGLGGDQGAPSIILTGDLNLPFIREWNRPALEALCARVAERESSRQLTKDRL